MSEFLKDIFHVSNPDQSLGETITARDILDRGAARLDTELAGQPGIRATLMATIGVPVVLKNLARTGSLS